MCIRLTFSFQNEFIYSYKQSRRREDDIAIVNAGLRVILQPGNPHWTVQECSLAYGGMSYVTVMAKKTQTALLRKYVKPMNLTCMHFFIFIIISRVDSLKALIFTTNC